MRNTKVLKDAVVGVYARVSSDRQAQEGTIASQLEELNTRVAADGFVLSDELRFIDDGYSGSTLVRPALEQLRDVCACGGLDRLYVHSPDRLARRYAYQVLLLEELNRCDVEVEFLNQPVVKTAEDALLLQVQGIVAEYERAKILERSRRGRLHAARTGKLSALGTAPYGYRYVKRAEGAGEARYDIVVEQARVVRKIFDWIGRDRLSIGEVIRKLQAAGIPSPRGKAYWERGTVSHLLHNTTYKGEAAFGKTQVGKRRFRPRPWKDSCSQPRCPHSRYATEQEKWTSIPVPAIVSGEVFDAVQEQLEENRKRARCGKRGARYLLQGMVVCKQCGRAYVGLTRRSQDKNSGKTRQYSYYRCLGRNKDRFGGVRVCENGQVRVDLLDDAVWTDVSAFLAEPKRIEHEFRRRLAGSQRNNAPDEVEELRKIIAKRKLGLDRLLDAYTSGLLDKSDFEPRMRRLKEGLAQLQGELAALLEEQSRERHLQLAITRLEEFAGKVSDGLESTDWAKRREIIRALVKQIEIDGESVKIVYRLSPDDGAVKPRLQDCRNRAGNARTHLAKAARARRHAERRLLLHLPRPRELPTLGLHPLLDLALTALHRRAERADKSPPLPVLVTGGLDHLERHLLGQRTARGEEDLRLLRNEYLAVVVHGRVHARPVLALLHQAGCDGVRQRVDDLVEHVLVIDETDVARTTRSEETLTTSVMTV